jgi:mono/diheme cytochrome c family protein
LHEEATRVIFGWHVKTVVRFFSGLLTLLLVSGCEMEGYPEYLTYPRRADPLVDRTKTVSQDAPSYDLPGEFPQVIFAGLSDSERKQLLLEPANLSADQGQQLDTALARLFGTPAHPKVGGVESEVIQQLKLDESTLAHGSEIYRHQCLHCHGLTGDGRGPTAPWVNPHPRDYRQGIFKFTSSSQAEGVRKPRRDDLLRTLREGIDGTSMPSFRLLPDDDLDALASYVIHLSLRGQVEYQVIINTVKAGADADPIEEQVNDSLQQFAGFWQQAQKSEIKPGAYPYKTDEELRQSIQRGFDLFSRAEAKGSKKSAGCLACHLDYGRKSAYKYDYWGTIVRPADLTTGPLRGGRRPIDLYARIHSGVNGVTMPASSSSLEPGEIWDIVNFLEILPYPKMREKYGIHLEATEQKEQLAQNRE